MGLATISAVGTLKSTGFVSVVATLSVSPTTIGNAMVFSTWVSNTGTTPTVATVTGGGCTNWRVILPSTQFTSPPATQRGDVWIGTVTTPGASTITITSSTGSFPGNNALYCQEFTAGTGPNTIWSLDAGQTGVRTNGSASTTITFPTLTPGGPNRCYIGPGYAGGTGSTTGGTAGYTVQLDANNNPFIYNTNVSTAQSPTSVQTSSTSDAMGVLIFAVDPAPGRVATSMHPGRGPGFSRFIQTRASTAPPVANPAYGDQFLPYFS